ncbi:MULTISPECIES: sporulation-specific diadenylate cyclase CdaS [Paenibacillus]|uniref:DAC domain-containing protein n=1 Tax=Paenibacillus albilobatus TaxID=2716884 RepID=A0A920CA67_9BACL|nr:MULTISPECIES: sporulation-specific diadenylate cyclase CdaS [Paenibacillus]GIO29172.1 hypothetical protein J2TS6_03130 [Paenibacillus albilobatus]
MENEYDRLSPQPEEIKRRLEDISDGIGSLISSLDKEQIGILKEIKHLYKRFSTAGKMASRYHLNRLLFPYTTKCGEIIKAVGQLSEIRKGALIVIEREKPVDDWITRGTPLFAEISSELLDSIFHVGSPLHDGAVLIRKDTIVSAANILPLTKKIYPNKKLGTRHRAAIGMSERTDALVFVVSEETGKESFSFNGALYPFQTLK